MPSLLSSARRAGPPSTAEGFLLSRGWRDALRGLQLELWLVAQATNDATHTSREPVRVVLRNERAVMFVERTQPTRTGQRREVQLASLRGVPVDAVYFGRQAELVAERNRLLQGGARVFEGDVKPAERFLMERFVTAGVRVTGECRVVDGVRTFFDPKVVAAAVEPSLLPLSVDIETDGFDGPLISIAAVGKDYRWCGMVWPPPEPSTSAARENAPSREGLHYFEHPRSLLQAFFEEVHDFDPDLLVGWNLIEFDLKYLQALCRKLHLPFQIGRAGGLCRVLEPSSASQPHLARIDGRLALDGIVTLRNSSIFLESYALDDVAQHFLGKGKVIRKTGDALAEIRRMYREDPLALAHYNEADCELVLEVFERADLLALALERQKLTGLSLDRVGGSVAALDHMYLPRLHRAGCVAPSVAGSSSGQSSPGGYVFESKPGLYKDVLVLDFKSLYPSIMVTFRIDPYGLATAGHNAIEGFEGARFAREGHILPELVQQLWRARDNAKREGNGALSQAIKITMNSLYGVLGTPGCRFFDHRLVSSITRRGHEILTCSRGFLEGLGHTVIYGDTDSLFVHLSGEPSEEKSLQRGSELATELNRYWHNKLLDSMGIESHLEIEFETHYLRFLMPTMRGSERGTKKRYAGSTRTRDGSIEVTIKGMEAVRTDWTPAARQMQRELFRRVFTGEPHEPYLVQTVRALFAQKMDDQLVYRKRLRRALAQYERNVPPHVQAARKLAHPGKSIEYVITTAGPEPVEQRTAPLDYQHYFDRQLAPAADSLLEALGTDLESITGSQLKLL